MRDRLDELLTRGHLGGAERERLLARLLAAHAPPPWWRRRSVAWLLPALATAVVLFFLVPRRVSEDGFRARGRAPSAVPSLLVGCEDGQREHCRSGQKLLFSIAGATEPGFVGAYAEPVGGEGERIWYFPSPDGRSPATRADRELQTLSRAVRLGREQPAGRYVVHLVYSRRALSRDEILRARGPDVLATDRATIDIAP